VPSSPRVVITDANILINLIHVGRLDLLGTLPAFTFVVPEHVVAEITDPGQRQHLASALALGELRQESITDLHALTTYAELRRIMGQGEAACLALAEARGRLIASDEKRRFRREVQVRLGTGRLVTTAGLFVLAIRAGTLSVEQADQAKATWEQHRFRLPFGSFRELLAEHGSDDTLI
jgi:predicted nucleic acid-binding protein